MGRSALQFIQDFVPAYFCAQRTYRAENVPMLYREPGVLSGYRPMGRSFTYYVRSIFNYHNESINVWTHLIAPCLFILKLLSLLSDPEFDTWKVSSAPFVAFGICSVSYTMFSAFAHAFHSKSPYWHYVCFQIDYCGIGLYGLGKCILFLYCSCPEAVFHRVHEIYVPFNVIFGWVLMTGCCIAKLKYRRPYPFKRKLIQLCSGIFQACFGCIPLASRYITCFVDADCSMASLNHHSIWLLGLTLSLFFFSSHLPEKKCAGAFDFIGQGHQVFHILIVITTLLQYDAASHDAAMLEHSRDVSGVSLCGAIGVYLLGSVCILSLLTKFVRTRIREDMATEQTKAD